MNESELLKLTLGGFKRGTLSYHIADFTPRGRSKSWAENVLFCEDSQEEFKTFSGISYRSLRSGGKTVSNFWHNYYLLDELFSHKQIKLLQSKSKCPRIVRVVIK